MRITLFLRHVVVWLEVSIGLMKGRPIAGLFVTRCLPRQVVKRGMWVQLGIFKTDSPLTKIVTEELYSGSIFYYSLKKSMFLSIDLTGNTTETPEAAVFFTWLVSHYFCWSHY